MKESVLRWILRIAAFGLAVGLSLGAGAEDETKAAPKCLKAEINPVTGHTLCIDPVGAPVEAAPKEWLEPCKQGVESGESKDAKPSGAWTFRPNCTPRPDEG